MMARMTLLAQTRSLSRYSYLICMLNNTLIYMHAVYDGMV